MPKTGTSCLVEENVTHLAGKGYRKKKTKTDFNFDSFENDDIIATVLAFSLLKKIQKSNINERGVWSRLMFFLNLQPACQLCFSLIFYHNRFLVTHYTEIHFFRTVLWVEKYFRHSIFHFCLQMSSAMVCSDWPITVQLSSWFLAQNWTCSNRRRFLAPEKSGTRKVWQTDKFLVPETGAWNWPVCHHYKSNTLLLCHQENSQWISIMYKFCTFIKTCKLTIKLSNSKQAEKWWIGLLTHDVLELWPARESVAWV